MRRLSPPEPLRLPVRTVTWLASHLLVRPQRYEFTDEKRRAFESSYETLLESGGDVPHSPLEFLAYVVREKPVVLHGSSAPGIETFEPRTQTDWRGTETTAVFATTDPLLAAFFAVVDREAYTGPLRNGGFLVETPLGGVARRQYFSLALEQLDSVPFSPGTVSLLPEDAFEPAAYSYVGFDEWYCDRPIEPVASLSVEPEAFPVSEYVVGHRDGESMAKSVALYRWRRRAGLWSR